MKEPGAPSILAQLRIVVGIPVGIAVLVAIATVFAVRHALDATQQVRQSREVIIDGLRMQREFLKLQQCLLHGRVSGKVDRDTFDRVQRGLSTLIDRTSLAVADHPGQSARLDRQQQRLAEWDERALKVLDRPAEFVAVIDELAGGGDRDEASSIDEGFERFIEDEKARLDERSVVASRASNEILLTVAVGATCLVLLGLTITTRLAAQIARPVRALTEAARNLHLGKFAPLAPEGPSEIAELTTTFNMLGVAIDQRMVALEASEFRFRTIVGATTQIMWVAKPDGMLTDENRSWLDFTGQDASELAKTGLFAAIHPDDRDEYLAKWKEAEVTHQPFTMECRLRRRDDTYCWIESQTVPVLSEEGVIVEWVGTNTDITERRVQEQIRQEKEAAEASNIAKSEFLARMSHELRTPLNAVIGMSRMLTTLRFGPLTTKQSEYLRDIHEAGVHLLGLINQILDLSKVEAGRMELHVEPFEVGAAIADVMSTMTAVATDRNVRLHFEHPVVDRRCSNDLGKFKQVLYNLLSNAIKFTPAQGDVTVDLAFTKSTKRGSARSGLDDAKAFVVHVRDTGIGISAKAQKVMWEEFRQVGASAHGAREGTGLGLPLARKLVELMQGEIWVESEPGKGSSFAFSLPCVLWTRTSETGSINEVKLNGEAVALVVEDHVPTRTLLCDWLAELNVQTMTAGDGAEALEACRIYRPDIIMLDVRLPRMDGWEFLTNLKADVRLASIPVVVVTVLADRKLAGSFAIADYFIKPIDKDLLLERVRDLLGASAMPVDGVRRFLAVDDDLLSLEMLTQGFADDAAVEFVTCTNGDDALRLLGEHRIDAILLDLLMPDKSGFEVAAAIRERSEWAAIPILVITAKDITPDDRRLLNDRVQAVLTKHEITPETLKKELQAMGMKWIKSHCEPVVQGTDTSGPPASC